MTNDRLNLAALQGAIGEPSPKLAVFDLIDSTNEEAKRRAIAGERDTVLIVANEQSAGRGRMGRSFYSPKETGIYFSVLKTLDCPLDSGVTLTGAAAVAVMRAIRRVTGIQTGIKWVNDLYLNGKKVCGILAEALSGLEDHSRQIILGVGINLNTEIFPDELLTKAGALHADGVTRAELIAAIWQELEHFLSDFTDRSWLDDYRTHSTVIGKAITWIRDGESFCGTATGINRDGELEVKCESGALLTLRTGEISVRLN